MHVVFEPLQETVTTNKSTFLISSLLILCIKNNLLVKQININIMIRVLLFYEEDIFILSFGHIEAVNNPL